MKLIAILMKITLAGAALFGLSYFCNAQAPGTPAQKVNSFYEFGGVKSDSAHIIPIVAPSSRYDSTGSMYLNTSDKKIHWHYAIGKDTTFLAPLLAAYPFDDTLVKIYACIPRPTGTGVNGTPITWSPIKDGGHFCSSQLDSMFTYDAGTGTLSIGFATCQAVSYATIGGDEQSGALNWYTRMNDDAAEFSATIMHAGIGLSLVADGTGGWGKQIQNLGAGYVFTQDTTDANSIFFTLTDASGYALNGTSSSIAVNYVGAHNYHMHRSFNGLTQAFKYLLWNDSTHLQATGLPDTSDRVDIFYGSNWPSGIDLSQYLTSTNPYLFQGLPNEWFITVVKEYPNSLKITPPQKSAGIIGCNLAVISSTAIDISWLAPASGNDSIYEVRRALNPTFKNEVSVFRGPAIIFHDTGLTTATHYYYRVTAIRTRNGSEDVHSNWVFNNGTTL